MVECSEIMGRGRKEWETCRYRGRNDGGSEERSLYIGGGRVCV